MVGSHAAVHCSIQDVKIRLALALARYSRSNYLSSKIPLEQKLRLYKAGVLSVLAFGPTIWKSSKQKIAKLNEGLEL